MEQFKLEGWILSPQDPWFVSKEGPLKVAWSSTDSWSKSEWPTGSSKYEELTHSSAFPVMFKDVTLQELGFYTRYCVKGCFTVIPMDNLVLRLRFDKVKLRNCDLEEEYQSK